MNKAKTCQKIAQVALGGANTPVAQRTHARLGSKYGSYKKGRFTMEGLKLIGHFCGWKGMIWNEILIWLGEECEESVCKSCICILSRGGFCFDRIPVKVWICASV